MSTISELESRLKRAEQTLTRVADGDFEQSIVIGSDSDALASLEMGINFMILDLRAMMEENRAQEQRLRRQAEELAAKLVKIEQQEAAIRELSTPVIEVWDDVLVLPIVGILDTKRSVELMNNLLQSIVRTQSKNIIIDITGVEVVDTKTADYLLKVVRAARLLGARCVLTGLGPAVAQTLVDIGADLTEVTTLRNLKEGLKHCLGRAQIAPVASAVRN
jgi:rsbT co-antagonist protein RsbR